MSTATQALASRANAQHSTGPRSVEGKAASSRNALKFGIFAEALIIPGEDPEEFAALHRSYEEQFRPVGSAEVALLEIIVRSEWMMARYARLEAAYINRAVSKMDKNEKYPVAAALLDDAGGPKVLDKIYRRQRAARRDWDSARNELEVLRQERRASERRAAMRAQSAAAPPPAAKIDPQVRFADSLQPQSAPPPKFADPAYDDRALRL